MKTRNILKGITILLMVMIGLYAMVLPYEVDEIGVMLGGFLFFILGLRSVFYELDKKDRIWRSLDIFIEKRIIKKNTFGKLGIFEKSPISQKKIDKFNKILLEYQENNNVKP